MYQTRNKLWWLFHGVASVFDINGALLPRAEEFDHAGEEEAETGEPMPDRRTRLAEDWAKVAGDFSRAFARVTAAS